MPPLDSAANPTAKPAIPQLGLPVLFLLSAVSLLFFLVLSALLLLLSRSGVVLSLLLLLHQPASAAMDDSSSPSSAGGHGRQARGAHHGSSTGGGGGRGKQERRKPRGGGGGGGASGGGDSGDSQWQHDRFDHSPKHHGSYQSDHRRGGGGGGGRGGGRHTVQRQVVARDETGLISSVKDSYGFIKCCDRNQRMFFHFSELQPSRDSSEQPPGQVGDEVQFDVALDPEGKSSAVNIRLLPPGSVSFERVLDGRMEGIVTRSLAGDLLDRWAQRPDAKELLSRLSAAAAASSSSSSSSSFSNDRPKRAFIPGVICFSTRDSTNEPSSSTEAAAIDGTAATAATAAAATSLEEAQGSNATVASDGASPSAAATSALVDEETETVTFTGRDIESSKFDAAAGDVVSFQFAVDKRTGERRATNIRLVKKAPEERFTGFITSIKPPYGFIDCCERDQTIFFSLSEIQQPAAATPAPAPVPAAAAATTTSIDDATTAAPDASSDSKTETTSEPPAPIAAATTPAAPATITWGGRSPAPKTTVPHIKERQEVEFSLVTDRKSKEKRAVNIKLLPPGSISLHNILPERERGFVSKPIPERRSKQHRLDRVRSDPLDELGRIEKIIGIDEENNMETVEILSFAARDLEQPYIKLRFDDEVEFNVAVEKRTGKRRCTNISLVQPANEQREAGCIEAVKEGFGFIRRLRSDTELYFHFSDIELPEQRLAVGTEVDFIVDEDAQSHKQFAARIRPLQQTLHDGVLIGYVQRLPTRGAKRHSDSSSNGTILVNKFVPVVAAPATPAPDAAPEATATAPATTDASPATPAADSTTTIPDQQQQHEEEDDEEHDAEHESDDEHEATTPAAAAAAAATVVTATASAADATVKPTKRPSSKPRQRRVEEHIEFDLSGVEANQELVVGEQVMFRVRPYHLATSRLEAVPCAILLTVPCASYVRGCSCSRPTPSTARRPSTLRANASLGASPRPRPVSSSHAFRRPSLQRSSLRYRYRRSPR